MPKSHSHVHDRSYFGEFDAGPVIEWLNAKARPAGDPVETLLTLNGRLPIEAREHEVGDYLAKIVRTSKLAVAPVLIDAAPGRWRIDWRLVGKMDSRQALALIRLLHLADKGLIGRVNRCANGDCGKWFYARFEHQRFHSAQCQQEAFRSDPEWKKQRREYMKELRQAKKLREQKWLRLSKTKRKGKR